MLASPAARLAANPSPRDTGPSFGFAWPPPSKSSPQARPPASPSPPPTDPRASPPSVPSSRASSPPPSSPPLPQPPPAVRATSPPQLHRISTSTSAAAASASSASSSPQKPLSSSHTVRAAKPRRPPHLAMSSASTSFSPISNHRHSSLFSGTLPAPVPRSTAASFAANSLSSLAAAAAGDTLRPAVLDESALAPAEYAAYLPALLSLKQAPSGIAGLYDELSALHYLRDKCKLQLKDEAMILALFERTPLGIKPGHFYAWLRLVSWVQQGQTPSKRLLFTQTAPAQTFIGAGSGPGLKQSATHAYGPPPAGAAGHPYGSHKTSVPSHPAPALNASAGRHTSMPMALGASRRHAGVTATPLIKPKARMASLSQLGLGMPSSSNKVPDVPFVPSSSKNPFRDTSRPNLPPPPVAPPTTHIVAPPSHLGAVPPLAGAHTHHHREHHREREREHHHRDRERDRDREREREREHHQPRDVEASRPSQPIILHHAAPALPAPAPPPPPRPGQLPLDALIGFNPAPNPFKQTKPRLVRPTPVVATSAVAARRPATRQSHLFDAKEPERDEERAEDTVSAELGSTRSPTPSGLPLDESHMLYAGFKQGVLDRLGAPLPTRAPISPLIQAGLHAASERQKARQALGPKTYTTIQRSTKKPKPVSAKHTRHERLGPGSAAGPAHGSRQGDATPITGLPVLIAPQPRHATAGRDLTSSLYKKKADEESVKSGGSAPSIHTGRSKPSSHHASERDSDQSGGTMAMGELLDTHLASLGAGGRPKSRLSTRAPRNGPASSHHHEVREARLGGSSKGRAHGTGPGNGNGNGTGTGTGRSTRVTSSVGPVPQWLRDQDALHPRAGRQLASRQSRSSTGGSHSFLSPQRTREEDSSMVMLKSPLTVSSVAASSVDVQSVQEESEPDHDHDHGHDQDKEAPRCLDLDVPTVQLPPPHSPTSPRTQDKAPARASISSQADEEAATSAKKETVS